MLNHRKNKLKRVSQELLTIMVKKRELMNCWKVNKIYQQLQSFHQYSTSAHSFPVIYEHTQSIYSVCAAVGLFWTHTKFSCSRLRECWVWREVNTRAVWVTEIPWFSSPADKSPAAADSPFTIVLRFSVRII